jgi:murein tripeptide amidase MpaA
MALLTRAEATNYEFTSLHAEVMTFIAGLAAKGDSRLHITSFGTSAEGRELPLLVLSAHGAKTPAEARALGLPVVLVICGIHAGEVEGKEGCLMLTRDLLENKAGLDAELLLANLTLVIVPLFNPDGNDAIDPGNRRLDLPKLTGQLGPESGVGTRVNAGGRGDAPAADSRLPGLGAGSNHRQPRHERLRAPLLHDLRHSPHRRKRPR